jgi:hypothetical protein
MSISYAPHPAPVPHPAPSRADPRHADTARVVRDRPRVKPQVHVAPSEWSSVPTELILLWRRHEARQSLIDLDLALLYFQRRRA